MPVPTVVGTSVASRYSDPTLTVPGSANYVIGGGSYVPGGADPGAAATLGGNAMAIVGTPASWAATLASILFGYANPTAAAHVFAPTGTGRVNRIAMSLADVDTASPADTAAVSSGTSTAPSVTITTDTNALAVALVSFGALAGVTISAGAGETVVIQYVEDGRASALLTKAGAASVSFAPTLSGSTDWHITAVGINGTVAAGGQPTMRRWGGVPFMGQSAGRRGW